jgi:hypothetical protein
MTDDATDIPASDTETATVTGESETIPATEPATRSLEARVSALEQALASLGDTVSPGGSRALAAYANWRNSVALKG